MTGSVVVADVIRRVAGTIVVDEPSTRIDGKTQTAGEDIANTKLWAVPTGRDHVPSHASLVTLVYPAALAVQVSALHYIQHDVVGTGFSIDVDRIVEPDNSTTLLGMINSFAPVA